MRTYPFVVLFAIFIAALSAGCGGGPGGSPAALTISSLTAPAVIASGGSGQFVVSFSGGVAPYGIVYSFSGDAVTSASATHTQPAGATSDALSVEFATTGGAARDGSLTVTVTDADGTVATRSIDFAVPASVNLREPSIVDIIGTPDAVLNSVVLDVALDGTPSLAATVTVSAPAGVNSHPTAANVNFDASGSAHVSFRLLRADPASADEDITVDVDGKLPLGGHEQQVYHAQFGGQHLAPDTLYAIPLLETARVGQRVPIVITTGDPANPLHSVAGVRVCLPSGSGFDFVPGSLNFGAPGGNITDVDGFWSAMPGLQDGDFLLYPDTIWWDPIETGDGRRAIDFNVSPLGSENVLDGAGPLFNFELTFANLGTWKLSFQQTNVVNRTYYQDGNQATDYFWGDITNNHPGVPNSVTVIP